MKKRIINSNREKQYMCYQSTECAYRVKNNVLHPYFLESQPEKAENRIFFIGSDKALFDKIQTHKICQNLGPASTISWKLKNPFFSFKISHTQWGTFLDPGVKIFGFWSMVKTGGSSGVQKCLSIGIDKRSKIKKQYTYEKQEH